VIVWRTRSCQLCVTVGSHKVLTQQAEVAIEQLSLWVVREERLHGVGARQERIFATRQLISSGHHRNVAEVGVVVVVPPSGKLLDCNTANTRQLSPTPNSVTRAGAGAARSARLSCQSCSLVSPVGAHLGPRQPPPPPSLPYPAFRW
jgi:hypothetical protein